MYLTVMAVLIIFPLILQTVVDVRMLSVGGWGGFTCRVSNILHYAYGAFYRL